MRDSYRTGTVEIKSEEYGTKVKASVKIDGKEDFEVTECEMRVEAGSCPVVRLTICPAVVKMQHKGRVYTQHDLSLVSTEELVDELKIRL